MFLHRDIRGTSLPPRTVCLTYDDGPGPETMAVARYLYRHDISACFFVMGKHAAQFPATMTRLRDWGHIVGNHTYSHPGLVDFALAGGDVVGEVVATHEIIEPYLTGDKVFLRPPYGSWRQKTRPDGPQDFRTSIVAQLLNRGGRFDNYVGPILWDIVGEDWECWRTGLSPAECVKRYLDAAQGADRGIILMHDCAEEEELRLKNRVLELTTQLVPALAERGFRFARLDAVPEFRALGVSASASQGEPSAGRAPKDSGENTLGAAYC
jgi:peptidoglycan/xylan/chitin deacetylase (PgdA/CDA1 family)